MPPRTALFMPASNSRALAKAPTLACDAIILDLEDAVAPDDKDAARESARGFGHGHVLRVNGIGTPWHEADLELADRADAVLLPKVEDPAALARTCETLRSRAKAHVWAMIETPLALMRLGELAALRDHHPNLTTFVVGANDLAKEIGLRPGKDRTNLVPLLLQIVVAARAHGLAVLDSVANDFRDLDAFAAECAQGRALGFDGKTLIHPAQIDPANRAFSPSAEEVAEANAIVAAFEGITANVVQVEGRMVERLHLETARATLARAAALDR